MGGGRENPRRDAASTGAVAGVFDDRHDAVGMDLDVWSAAKGATTQAILGGAGIYESGEGSENRSPFC